MKQLTILIILFLFIGLCYGDEIDFDKMVDAIGKAENSEKYPYGIKSIDTKGDSVYARQICYNSVRNNYKRWIVAGKPKDFISFMGDRYCPSIAHSLNKNWVKNVTYFYNKEAK